MSVFAPLGDVMSCSSTDGAFVGVILEYIFCHSSRCKIEDFKVLERWCRVFER